MRNTVDFFIFPLLLITFAACDRTDSLLEKKTIATGKEVLTNTSTSAMQVIEQCKDAYQKLSSYEDDGYVLLRYEMDGKPIEDRAPLSIAFQRPRLVGVRAYAVEAGPSEGRWRLRVSGEAELDVTKQVLSRAVPEKVDFAWLLGDPIVGEQLSAGLAGFPPQLDMLLSSAPMKGLVDNDATLVLDGEKSIDDQACYVVRVTRSGADYRLWIDKASMTLRRLQLPSEHLSPAMLADKRVSKVQLSIEIPHVNINHPIRWQRFEVKAQPDELLVCRFVPAPPTVPVERLGAQLPAFRLQGTQGEEIFDTSKNTDKTCVYYWLADHPACQNVAAQLAQVAEAVKKSAIADKIEFMCMWAEPNPPAGLTFAQLKSAWNLPGALALDREAIGRDLFHIREAPTIVVLDSKNRLQVFEERANPYLDQILPNLLTQISNGNDLATELKLQVANEEKRHAAELRMSAAIDAKLTNFPSVDSYPTNRVRLTEVSKAAIDPTEVVAIMTDEAHMLWSLSSDGILSRVDEQGKRDKYQTPWKNVTGSARLEISSGGKYIALAEYGSSQISLFDTSINQNRQVSLGAVQVVDFHWLALAGSLSPRLAVVTTENETILLDPDNHEQLSGRSQATPLALVALSEGQRVGGFVVMADKAIEHLLVSSDSAQSAAPLLGQTVSHQAVVEESSTPTKLSFQPSTGPWKTVRIGNASVTLARGWVAQDEPGVFLLNEKLQQQWHYRTALMGQQNQWVSVAGCKDPSSGQTMWALNQGDNTIHLLRGDAAVTDHFQVDETIRGLGLAPSGNRLRLYVAHPHQIVTYEIGE